MLQATAPSISESAGPVTTAERIPTLDVVRGVALLGIFIMNMPYFGQSFYAIGGSGNRWPEWWNRFAEVGRDVLFSGKFNSMFSLLFAVGFTIQLGRLQAKLGADGTRIYVRRIVWLMVFGVVHACVFWTGDVLHMYALFGFVLLAIRKVPDRYVVALLGACLLYAPVRGAIVLATSIPEQTQQSLEVMQAWQASNDAAYGAGSFVDAVNEHVREMRFQYTDPKMAWSMLGFYVQLFTTVLIGLLLGRNAFFQRSADYLPQVRRVLRWSLLVGVVTGALFGAYESLIGNPVEPTLWGVIAGVSYSLCRVSTMAFYVCLIVLGMHHPIWNVRLAPFALAGRMPLTNYLLQTLAGTFLFYGWGLGFWGRIGPAACLVLAVSFFFLVQLPLSAWWLRRHEFGPMERLWRALTYGRAAAAGS